MLWNCILFVRLTFPGNTIWGANETIKRFLHKRISLNYFDVVTQTIFFFFLNFLIKTFYFCLFIRLFLSFSSSFDTSVWIFITQNGKIETHFVCSTKCQTRKLYFFSLEFALLCAHFSNLAQIIGCCKILHKIYSWIDQVIEWSEMIFYFITSRERDESEYDAMINKNEMPLKH